MNFKTTITLLIVLLVVGAVLLFTREPGDKMETPAQAKLLDISSGDIARVAFTSDNVERITLEKTDGKWRLSEPVKAPADESAASALVDAIASLQSRGRIDAGPDTGLDAPRFKLEVGTKDNKTIKLDVGSRSGAGDNLYVRRDGQAQADVVPASLYDQLDKPLKQWRRDKLFDFAATDIKKVRIATTQQTVALQKEGENWKIAQPTSMPAESTEASDITIAVANLRAADFVSQKADEAKRYGLDQPVMTVSFATQAPAIPPATQPATAPTITTIQFGRFDDVLKKNVYAMTSAEPGIFTVAASSLDAFRKKPIELRDKKLLSIDENQVTKIAIQTNKPATTQPTTREAVEQTVVIERAKRVIGPPAPTSAPATGPATTQAATQPAEPPAKWTIASSGNVDANDSKVEQLLGEFKPLRVERYLETAPTTQPSASYTLTIDTTDARHDLRLVDPGNAQPVIGSYNGLTFEVARSILEKLESDFAKQPATK